ncbi:hypothetical protein J6W32_02085 [bacterium]|nr:hypothetical protein [bacterium]MBP5783382.1 hypothetical protein [bacterium]
MPKTETDNFTKKVKYELIMKKYNQDEQKFLIFGYFFQSPHLDQLNFHLKLNLINNFIVQLLSQLFKLKDIKVTPKQINISFSKENLLGIFIQSFFANLLTLNKKNKDEWYAFLVG